MITPVQAGTSQDCVFESFKMALLRTPSGTKLVLLDTTLLVTRLFEDGRRIDPRAFLDAVFDAAEVAGWDIIIPKRLLSSPYTCFRVED